jgi:glycosyltransferase involved in cell wall biosynthesis
VDASPVSVTGPEPVPPASPPRIAVIIPCFGDGVLLADALGSLRHQEPCEVVVVDDGSIDQPSLDALRAFERQGVHVLRQENLGPSAARNRGLAATSAPYVFPLDADDMVFPGSLTALADVLDRHPEVSVAWGTATLFGEGIPETTSSLRVANLDPWRITYLNEIPGAALIRRTALSAVAGWREGTGYEDWDLWMALAEQGHRGAGIELPVQRYRIHGSRRWRQVSRQRARVYDEIRRAHPLLYARRLANWSSSRAPLPVKVLLPMVEVLPLSRLNRWRLTHLLLHPSRVLSEEVLHRKLHRTRRGEPRSFA